MLLLTVQRRMLPGGAVRDNPASDEPRPKPGHMPNWMTGHISLAQELSDACLSDGGPYDMLWYGDSITESFREKVRGQPCLARCPGIGEVWDRHYGEGSGLRAAALGSAGESAHE